MQHTIYGIIIVIAMCDVRVVYRSYMFECLRVYIISLGTRLNRFVLYATRNSIKIIRVCMMLMEKSTLFYLYHRKTIRNIF